MEYLFAEIVASQIIEDDQPDAESILSACAANAGDIVSLPVAIQFLSEILAAGGTRDGYVASDQRQFARRILKLLVTRKVLARYVLFAESLRGLSADRPLSLRVIVRFLDPGLVAGWAVLAAVVVSTIGVMGSIGLLYERLSVPAFLVTSTIGMMTAFWTRFRKSNPTYHALSVWNRLCMELQFDARTLFHIAGTGWLPWAKSSEFDFFLKKRNTN